MTVICIICRQAVPFSEATAGSLYADGAQAYACNNHIYERGPAWTLAWIAFDAEQQQQSKRSVRTTAGAGRS